MFLYNLRIAAKSLRRNPVLTALLVGAIALGICISTTFIALRHVYEKDPLPGKSSTLFNVRIDSWDPTRPYDPEDPKSVPPMLTWRDSMALMKSNIPTRQTAMFKYSPFVFPDPKVGKPFRQDTRLVYTDFFPMFNVPFRYGGPWDKAADAKPEQVVVIGQEVNERLFGGGNSVGRTVRLDQRDYKVVGVLDEWQPVSRYFDMNQGGVGSQVEGIYMPINFTPILEIFTTGNSDGWKGQDGDGFQAYLNSEQTWLVYWAELPTVDKQQAFRDFVDSYVTDQKKLGRLPRAMNNRVTAVPQLLEEFGAVPSGVKSMSIVSLLFLIVCSLNLVGLLLGKFLARVPEVSVRRALGASKFQVFWQHVVECELVGVAGGLIGLALSIGILELISKFIPNGDVIGLDLEMVGVSLFLSLVAGLLAGIYPSWRVCSVAPAMQLKVQ